MNDMIPGIDVSHHNGKVDWNAAAEAGIKFAFVKASEGANTGDSEFASNWAGMKAAGIVRGAYHFFHPEKAVSAQVDNFLRQVPSLSPGDLPPVIDLEWVYATDANKTEQWALIEQAKRVPLAIQWMDAVKSTLGCTPIVYTSDSFVRALFGSAGETLVQSVLWTASYGSHAIVPAGWPTWNFWQYSDKGQVAGVTTPADVDWFNGEVEDLQNLTVK
jgi:lysozyme